MYIYTTQSAEADINTQFRSSCFTKQQAEFADIKGEEYRVVFCVCGPL